AGIIRILVDSIANNSKEYAIGFDEIIQKIIFTQVEIAPMMPKRQEIMDDSELEMIFDDARLNYDKASSMNEKIEEMKRLESYPSVDAFGETFFEKVIEKKEKENLDKEQAQRIRDKILK